MIVNFKFLSYQLLLKKLNGDNKKEGTYDIPEGDSWNRMTIKMDNLSILEKEELYKDTNIKFVLENLNNLLP
jgi:hypothetical protein